MRNHFLSPLYDGLLSTAAAPDHLLTGIGKNVLILCFQNISTEERIFAVEMKVFIATSNKDISLGNILKWDKNYR